MNCFWKLGTRLEERSERADGINLRLHANGTLYVQQLLVVKEEVHPEHQEWSSSLDQEDPEPPHIKEEQEDPEPPHIKEEQEELWTSREGEQLQGLEETDVKFSFIPVKTEDGEEEAQSSELHRRQTEQMYSSDTDDSDDWKETREPQSGSNSVKPDEVLVSDSRCSADKKLFRCSECEKTFGQSGSLKKHMRIHTGKKRYSCSVCKKSFAHKLIFLKHMRIHTGEEPFSCSVCDKSFTRSRDLKQHMRTHMGETPFSCSVCDQGFIGSGDLKQHMRIHT